MKVILALLASLVPLWAGERERECVANLLALNKRAPSDAIRKCLLASPRATVIFRFTPSQEREAQISLFRSQSDGFRLRIVLSPNLERSQYSPNAPARAEQLQQLAEKVQIGEVEATRQQFFEWVTQSRNAAEKALTGMLIEVANSPFGHGIVIVDGSTLELSIMPMSMQLTITASGPEDIYDPAHSTTTEPFVNWMLTFLHRVLEMANLKPLKR